MVKKNCTIKILSITDTNKKILYQSKPYTGKVHDFNIFKKELGCFDFSKHDVYVDLGFLGIKKLLKNTRIFIPKKSSKNYKLTEDDKKNNQLLAKKRVKIEHVFSHLKRYHILKNRYKSLDLAQIETTLILCAGLSNFKKSFSNSF